ncbi:MAG: AtpZ/AtpI family protein [Lachnospiraceae bacterium]|nr:AtpZ/AtpI family protein [Lachnospiraceae bacterium]
MMEDEKEKKRKDRLEVSRAFSMVVHVGITMLVSIFICLAIGIWVDKTFHANVTVFFIFFGVVSGYCSAFSTLTTFFKGKAEKSELLERIEELADEEADDEDIQGE